MSKRIKVVIDKLGRPLYDVQGACGDECKRLTQPYEQAFGGIVESTEKPELYQIEQTTEHEQEVEL